MDKTARNWIAILLAVIMTVMTPLFHISTAYAENASSTAGETSTLQQVKAHFGEAEEGVHTRGQQQDDRCLFLCGSF